MRILIFKIVWPKQFVHRVRLIWSLLAPPLRPGAVVTGRAEKVATPGFSWVARAAHCSQSIHNNGYRGIYKVRRNQDICGKRELLSTIRVLINILIITDE